MEKDTIQQKKFPKSSKSKKILKALSGLFAIALIVGITIAGTLAYLGKKADTKRNTFTGSAGINLAIVEPAFETTKPGESKPEKKRAEAYTPGGKYLKDPMVYNLSSDACTEWVAIKVSFQLKKEGAPGYSNVSYETFSKLASIQTEATVGGSMTKGFANQSAIITSPNWTLIKTDLTSGAIAEAGTDPGRANGAIEDNAKYAIFVYKKAIKNNEESVDDTSLASVYTSGSITDPIFNQVEVKQQSAIDTIKSDPDITDYFTLDAGNITKYPGFQINVEAAAIKNEFSNVSLGRLAESLDEVSDPTEVENIKKALIALF